ncbi:HAUS augmin-like complex subunit 6 isoform X3 [Marmota monax]|uniref:HAUS augmin-like complex subunit 6 isoform X3 n=1 Tax=Marmota monax TaxID=9995 RepID=UPI0026F27EBC|nr:HAUS augmin-like complex subunit 6 isoform X3 [Marmota monax]
MSSAWSASFERQHLWMYLLALGFEPGPATIACGKIESHTHLGVNMFDKLNRDAFQIVSYFLFQTLDQSLTKEVFKFCWPPFDQKSDSEFRKHCCEWLKKISAECGNSFPQVVGSLFLSPGGPKFIHLMYHFARFVALKYIKTNSKNSSLHFTETFNVKPQDMHKCMARWHVSRNRFLQILQREDYVTQQYQENAQLSVKQVRNLRSECIELQNQIKKMEPCDDESNIQEKIQKVRSLWTSVNETLMFLEKEREVVSSVLSLVNQYALDGSNVIINIPRLLLDKIEKQVCQAVDLLPPMSPLSFDPVSEEVYARSILFQYPASLPDIPKQHNEEKDHKADIDTLIAVCDLANSSASFLLQPASSSDRNNVTLLEKMRTPKEKNETLSKKTPEFKVEDSSVSDVAKNTETRAFEGSLAPPKSDPFQKEQDHLVEEVAQAVLSDSPQLSEGKEVKLEELIDSLVSNPFLTRKQIPRTPENLITEIRSSWRKAIEVEDSRSTEPIQVDTEHREVLSGSLPVLHNQEEFSMASLFSDFDQSHLAEEKVVSGCIKGMPEKYVTSHKTESPVEDQSDLLNKKIICKQDLERTPLPTKLSTISQIERFSPTVGNRIDVIGKSEEKYIKILDCSQASYNEPSIHKTMLWNSFQIASEISSKSLKDTDFGILHETLPEEVGHLSLNSSSSSEANFKLESNSPVYRGIFPDYVGERQTTSESDFNLQAISSSYEALKKSLSKKREESYLFNSEALETHKPESSPSPKNMQADDMLNFLDTDDLLIDYTKPSLRTSLGERKQSLSPLIKFSPVEQKLKSTVPCGLGELPPNLKEEEILNKSLDVKEFDLTR